MFALRLILGNMKISCYDNEKVNIRYEHKIWINASKRDSSIFAE